MFQDLKVYISILYLMSLLSNVAVEMLLDLAIRLFNYHFYTVINIGPGSTIGRAFEYQSNDPTGAWFDPQSGRIFFRASCPPSSDG